MIAYHRRPLSKHVIEVRFCFLINLGVGGPRDHENQVPREILRRLVSWMSQMDGKVPKSENSRPRLSGPRLPVSEPGPAPGTLSNSTGENRFQNLPVLAPENVFSFSHQKGTLEIS